MLCPWGIVLLLFRPVPAQQPDRRTQWKQRAVCPAVPSPVQCGSEQQKEYVLSPKDICTLDLIPELIEAGVYSFKIEGRMKRPEYVAAVTSIYRKYTDLYLKKEKVDIG